MAITLSISVQQLTDPSTIRVTDTTENEDSEDFTARTLTITKSDGSALDGYENPINFPFTSQYIDITGFEKDFALNIICTLTPTTSNPSSVYTVTEDVAMNRFLQRGLYDIQAARFFNNSLPGRSGIKAQSNSIDLLIEMENSQTAVLYSNLLGAQAALDRGTTIIANTIL